MDAFLFEKINNFTSETLSFDGAGIFLAQYLPFILVASLFLFLFFNFKKYGRLTLMAFTAAFLSRLITELFRIIWERPRPFVENNVNVLIDRLNTSSFPSAHTSFFFAISAVVFYYNKKIGLLFFCLSFAMAVSRIYSGVHWPSDILGGILVGLLSAFIVIIIFNKFSKK
jgi:undecaprenyl-diphosphatase